MLAEYSLAVSKSVSQDSHHAPILVEGTPLLGEAASHRMPTDQIVEELRGLAHHPGGLAEEHQRQEKSGRKDRWDQLITQDLAKGGGMVYRLTKAPSAPESQAVEMPDGSKSYKFQDEIDGERLDQ